MSTSWDLFCVDCQADCGFSWNHGESALRTLWELRKEWITIGDKLSDASAQWYLLFYGTSEAGDIVEFARRHYGHEVRLKNEYGRLDNQCFKSVRCKECETYHHCDLSIGHDGPCRRVKP
jgi:hypothetical protein